MFVPVLLFVLAAEVGETAPRLPTVATVERIPLQRPAKSVTLTVYPFNKRIELRPTGDSTALVSQISAAGSRLCPRTLLDHGTVILQCTTRRLDGALVDDKGKLFLEIYEVRGVPWRGEENRIQVFYSPIAFRLGDGCPGDTPVARGECAYQDGQYTVAAVEFRRALTGDGRRVAAIRLGDIALGNQDAGTAAGWYQTAGRMGAFGRLAAARLCELSGACLSRLHQNAFDGTLLPEPLHTEMFLREARVAAYMDDLPLAMLALRQAIEAGHGGCEGSTQLFCRQLLLKVLQEPGKDGAVEALETYLALPGRTEGPLALTLIHAATEKAARLGAPSFAGNLMASSSQAVDASNQDLLGDFLLRTVELYLLGGDRTRARVVSEFAETRLGRAKLKGARWKAVLNELQGNDEALAAAVRAQLVDGEITRDLTLAYAALARATASRLSAEAAGDESSGAP
jgi:hypothetical protein